MPAGRTHLLASFRTTPIAHSKMDPNLGQYVTNGVHIANVSSEKTWLSSRSSILALLLVHLAIAAGVLWIVLSSITPTMEATPLGVGSVRTATEASVR